MLLTIASRQMFTAHVAADRRGDGVFAVMSLGNWNAQEPNNRIMKLKEIHVFPNRHKGQEKMKAFHKTQKK